MFHQLLTNDTIAEDSSLSTVMDFNRTIENEKVRLKKLNVHKMTEQEEFIRTLLRPKPEDVTRILHRQVPYQRLMVGEKMVNEFF